MYQRPAMAQEKAAVEGLLRSIDLVLALEREAQKPRSDERDKRIISLFSRIDYRGTMVEDKLGGYGFEPQPNTIAQDFLRLLTRAVRSTT